MFEQDKTYYIGTSNFIDNSTRRYAKVEEVVEAVQRRMALETGTDEVLIVKVVAIVKRATPAPPPVTVEFLP